MAPTKRLKRAQCRFRARTHSPKRAGDIGKLDNRWRLRLGSCDVGQFLSFSKETMVERHKLFIRKFIDIYRVNLLTKRVRKALH